MSKPPLGTACQPLRVAPRRQALSDRPSEAERCRHLPVRGATPDHLAVIRPPAATRLTARRRLRLDRPPHGRSWGRATGRLRVARRRAPALFRLTGPLSTQTSDTPSRAAGPGAASLSDRGSAPSCPDRRSPWARQCRRVGGRSRCLPSHGTGRTLLREPGAARRYRLAGRHGCRACSPVCETTG